MKVRIAINKVNQYRHYNTDALRKSAIRQNGEALFLVRADGSALIYWIEGKVLRHKKYAAFETVIS